MPKLSKRDVEKALAAVITGELEYREYGPDALGYSHCHLLLAGVDTHSYGRSMSEARRKMVEWAGCFRKGGG